MSLSLLRTDLSSKVVTPRAPLAITLDFSVDAPIAFDLNVSIAIVHAESGALVGCYYLSAGGWDVSWLPQGTYRLQATETRSALPEGSYTANLSLFHHDNSAVLDVRTASLPFTVKKSDARSPSVHFVWDLQSRQNTPPIETLSWRRGEGDWFSKHFDFEVRTIAGYLLKNSPLLKGKVLNAGCGDGTTDFGIALRLRPQEMVGIDPFRGFERLPDILKQCNFPITQLPENLRFLPASANEIPFPDDYFDVVMSWGLLEHIAGGYHQALKEMRRVLKPDGLLLVCPGLFYSDIGNHLGEFRFAREEPYVHLKHSREWLREKILSSQPDYIDRCGDNASSEQYWQWFTELNPITVPEFEKQLRDLDFEPWRVILRTHDHVEYTPELQKYSFVDLLAGELYVSAYNRKKQGSGIRD
ncbi:MAG: class I SAM-dependent methyltransferase [Proteobacteria bacterium]|nr:class I SAM-dependent methyltransferase [Pseudomonadota bacterium]MCL2308155.1 class I SAM-dependent methyltransferase [Pseudomonadota bacterium]